MPKKSKPVRGRRSPEEDPRALLRFLAFYLLNEAKSASRIAGDKERLRQGAIEPSTYISEIGHLHHLSTVPLG